MRLHFVMILSLTSWSILSSTLTLDEYLITTEWIQRPEWFVSAQKDAGIIGQDGGYTIILPDGALWIFGDTFGDIMSAQSNTILRIWTTTNITTNETIVTNAKYATYGKTVKSNQVEGTARQFITYEPETYDEFFNDTFIWSFSGYFNSSWMDYPFVTWQVGKRDANLSVVGNSVSFVENGSQCCVDNYTDYFNMVCDYVYLRNMIHDNNCKST